MPDDIKLPERRGMTVKSMIYGILGIQLVLAVFLMGGDLWRVIPTIGLPSSQPRFDQPVNPGDQTRRYRPANMPLPPAREGAPNLPYTSTKDMPERLLFEAEDTEIVITGRISPGDAERFETFLDAEGTEFKTVRLNSPGGSVSDALVIGQRLRDEGFDTAMSAGTVCLSACPYILASGVARAVDADARVGVHQHFYDVNTVLPAFLAVEDIQRGQGAVMAYLDEMGVDLRIMQHALVTPPDEIYVFLPDELSDYRLTFTPDPETSDPETN